MGGNNEDSSSLNNMQYYWYFSHGHPSGALKPRSLLLTGHTQCRIHGFAADPAHSDLAAKLRNLAGPQSPVWCVFSQNMTLRCKLWE